MHLTSRRAFLGVSEPSLDRESHSLGGTNKSISSMNFNGIVPELVEHGYSFVFFIYIYIVYMLCII